MSATYSAISTISSIYHVSGLVCNQTTAELWIIGKDSPAGEYKLYVYDLNTDTIVASTSILLSICWLRIDEVHNRCYMVDMNGTTFYRCTRNGSNIDLVQIYGGFSSEGTYTVIADNEIFILKGDKFYAWFLDDLNNGIYTYKEGSHTGVIGLIYNEHCGRYVTSGTNGHIKCWERDGSNNFGELSDYSVGAALYFFIYNKLTKIGYTSQTATTPVLVDCSSNDRSIIVITKLADVGSTEHDVTPTNQFGQRQHFDFNCFNYSCSYNGSDLDGCHQIDRLNNRIFTAGMPRTFRDGYLDTRLHRLIQTSCWTGEGITPILNIFRLNEFGFPGGSNVSKEYSSPALTYWACVSAVWEKSNIISRFYFGDHTASGSNLQYIEYEITTPEINPKTTANSIIIT